MNKKTKIKIVGLLLAGSLSAGGGVLVGDTMIKQAEAEALYQQVKAELFVRYLKNGTFEWRELQIFSQILDREAKEGKFKDIKNISKKNITRKMIDASTKEKVKKQ